MEDVCVCGLLRQKRVSVSASVPLMSAEEAKRRQQPHQPLKVRHKSDAAEQAQRLCYTAGSVGRPDCSLDGLLAFCYRVFLRSAQLCLLIVAVSMSFLPISIWVWANNASRDSPSFGFPYVIAPLCHLSTYLLGRIHLSLTEVTESCFPVFTAVHLPQQSFLKLPSCCWD